MSKFKKMLQNSSDTYRSNMPKCMHEKWYIRAVYSLHIMIYVLFLFAYLFVHFHRTYIILFSLCTFLLSWIIYKISPHTCTHQAQSRRVLCKNRKKSIIPVYLKRALPLDTRARISSQNSATSRHIIAIGMSTDNKRNPLHRMESSSIDSGRTSEAWIMHFTENVDITCEQKIKLTIAAENDLLLPISPA